jgi:hypothetical protein
VRTVRTQKVELGRRYPKLTFEFDEGSFTAEGNIDIDATDGLYWDSETVSVKIIAEGFPQQPPVVYDCSGTIPEEFEHAYIDGHLCLAVDTEMALWLSMDDSIADFLDRFVVNYYFQASRFRRFGDKGDFGRSHGSAGIISFFQEYFEVDADTARQIIWIVGSGHYRGRMMCPCGSKKRVGKCHGEKIKALLDLEVWACFKMDYERLREARAFSGIHKAQGGKH